MVIIHQLTAHNIRFGFTESLSKKYLFVEPVVVDRPDKAGRLAILQVHAQHVALARDANLETLAAMTPGFAGADLANMVDAAKAEGLQPRVIDVPKHSQHRGAHHHPERDIDRGP